MKVVADESVDGPIVARLREDGHEVDYIAEMEPGSVMIGYWATPTYGKLY